ncbi:MAG: hypothetical protein ACLP7J_07265 [Streptosporangiaceae bacterium]
MIGTTCPPGRRAAPRWIDHARWWHIYPLGFVGAAPAAGRSAGRTLDSITDWLDYAVVCPVPAGSWSPHRESSPVPEP